MKIFNLFINASNFLNIDVNEYIYKNIEYIIDDITFIVFICNENKTSLCIYILYNSKKDIYL